MTVHSSDNGFIHLTALVEVDSDMVSGSKVQTFLKGSNPVNMGLGLTTELGGTIFTDNSGALGNGSFVGLISHAGDRVQDVTPVNTVIFSQQVRPLLNTPTTKYLKIPIIVTGERFPFSLKIDDVLVLVDGKPKNIFPLVPFFLVNFIH